MAVALVTKDKDDRCATLPYKGGRRFEVPVDECRFDVFGTIILWRLNVVDVASRLSFFLSTT